MIKKKKVEEIILTVLSVYCLEPILSKREGRPERTSDEYVKLMEEQFQDVIEPEEKVL